LLRCNELELRVSPKSGLLESLHVLRILREVSGGRDRVSISYLYLFLHIGLWCGRGLYRGVPAFPRIPSELVGRLRIASKPVTRRRHVELRLSEMLGRTCSAGCISIDG